MVDTDNHRIQKFDGSGNFIAKWGRRGSGSGQFYNPNSIALSPDGTIYVTDTGNHRIQKFDHDGIYISEWGGYGSGNGKFIYPDGIALDFNNAVYIVDRGNSRVQKCDSNGTFLLKWGVIGSGDGQMKSPSGIAIAKDGYVYVTDSQYGSSPRSDRIQIFDGDGNFIAKWGSYGNGDGQFDSPEDIAIDSDGNIYVTDATRIQKFNSSHTFVTKWGSFTIAGSANGQFYSANGVAVTSDGFLYVTDNTNGGRIQKFDNNGNFVSKWNGYGSKAIAVAADGSVYTLDDLNMRVVKFDKSGNVMKSWGSYCVVDSNSDGIPDQPCDGRFYNPTGIAVGADGSVYVSETWNSRVQKFDSNGNFIKKWGIKAHGVAVGPDNYVYVTDYGNFLIQKFDSDGNFLKKWGGAGTVDGLFDNPTEIAVGSDGLVYVIDYGNSRVQKFDSNGNFVKKWSISDRDIGQLAQPSGIAAAPDGSVYVSDASLHRVDKMQPFSSGAETLFESLIPINQPADVMVDYRTDIGVFNAAGKLYLEATLKNNVGQIVSAAEYPFIISDSGIVFTLQTDKNIYKLGETITITGEVKNVGPDALSDVNIFISNRKVEETAFSQGLYASSFNLVAGGTHSFTFTTTAAAEGIFNLYGAASRGALLLADITNQFEVSTPKLTSTTSTPNVVGNDSFTIDVELKNAGKIDGIVSLNINNGSGQGDIQTVTIPAGETRLVQYEQQISQTTYYTLTFTGDLVQTVYKTVTYGLGVGISLGVVAPSPEGKVSIPVIILNKGQLNQEVTVNYVLQGSPYQETRKYALTKGWNMLDTLYFDLTAGTYQLTASSQSPQATAARSIKVFKDPDAVMATSAGTQGVNSLIPVNVNVQNNGYYDLNGSIAVAVMKNDGKAIWRGEAQVSGLKSQVSQNYVVNINSTDILPGAYSTTVTLYSTSGQQLVTNQVQVRVLGPIFEITSSPANPAFTAGKQGTLTFRVKNTGTTAGSATLSVRSGDLLNATSSNSMQPGEEKVYNFTFTVPEFAEAKNYLADYTLSSAVSQGTSGQAAFQIIGVNMGLQASLDKEAYRTGDTAALTLNISKQSQFEDGTYVAIMRYGSYHDMKTFTSSAQPVTLTFNVPLTVITGEKFFYGVHFESGLAINRNSISINESLADLAVNFKGQTTEAGALIPEVRRDNTIEIATAATNYGKIASTETTLTLYDADTVVETKPVRALNPKESVDMSFTWNVMGKGGSRTMRTVVDPNDLVAEYSEENNTNVITLRIPEITVFADTDKETYKIRQKVYITSTITNLTSATTYTNLLLLTSAKDSTGKEVYSKSISLGSLAPTSSTTTAEAWSTAGLSLEGIYTITQKVYSGSELAAQYSKQITLEKAVPDFSISVDVSSRKVKQGEQTTFNGTLSAMNGWSQEVSLSMEGLPLGSSVSFSPAAAIPPAQFTASVTTANTTPAGSHTLYLTGYGTDEGEIVTRTAQLMLDVSAFNVESVVPSITVKQIEQATYPITIGSVNGYEGTLNLAVSGLPKGSRGSFDTVTAQVPGTANLKIQTSKYIKPGTYNITVTGDDGLVQHSVILTLVIARNPAIAAGIIATQGPGPQNDAKVRLYDSNLQLIREFTAFNTTYGATAIAADIDGDGYDEIIVGQGPDPKNDAVLRAFKRDGTLITEYAAFTGKYGVTLAAADLDGDWMDEIIVGTGPDPKNPGMLKVLKYSNGAFIQVLAYTVNSQNSYGLNVAAGDVDGDNLPEIITAPGPGPNNPAIINTWKYTAGGLVLFNTITAFEGGYGVSIAAGDVDGDGRAEIIAGTGPDPKNASAMVVYKADGSLISAFAPFDATHAYGVTVSTADINGDGIAEILTGLGPGPQNETVMKTFSAAGIESGSVMAFPETVEYGVRVSGGNVGSR